MKYINFKRYKLAAIFKKIDIKRYKLTTFLKNIDFKRYIFSKIFKYFNYKRYKFLFLDIKNYNLTKFYKQINYKKIKTIPLYIIGFTTFSFFIYLCVPIFFNYDKILLNTKLCNELNIQCEIKGKVNYSIIPTPRLKIKDFIIYDLVDKNKILANFKNTEVKLPLNDLINKKKLNFKKIQLYGAQINLSYDKLSEYRRHFAKNISSRNIILENGNIDFFDGKKHITKLEKINFQYYTKKKADKFVLRGKFLGDDFKLNFENKKKEINPVKNLSLKLKDLNLLVKIVFSHSDGKENTTTGKAFIKKGKNKISGSFDLKEDLITIINANLRNKFLDGKLKGDIKFNPYFDFDLNVNLNTLNFNALYNSLLELDKEARNNLFKINNKINGKISLTSEKVFSKHTLINSFESQVKLINGDILIEQFLLSMGKLGAADFTGVIKNDKKYSNFKFENNIFIDNSKRFYSKFGVIDKKKAPSNLFISGKIDLVKLNLQLYEIMNDEKFNNQDILYIEKEFNDIILSDGYKSLFNFINIKEFVKLILTEDS